MLRSCLWGSTFGSLLLFTSVARAQCTKDTDCKGDRVCEAGACTAPAAAAPEDPNGWGVGAEAPATEATGAPAAAATKPRDVTSARANSPRSAGPTRSDAREPRGEHEERPAKPKTERHSVGMMAAGIVMVSISPIPLIAGMIYSIDGMACRNTNRYADGAIYDRDCDDSSAAAIGLTLTSLALIGVGVPLIVIGGKRVPAKQEWQAEISPYATPDGVGFGLRLKL